MLCISIRYRAITNAYYRGAQGALLVYDITRPGTFESVHRWLGELRVHTEPSLKIMLVGNKADLESMRSITIEDGKQLSEQEGLFFTETSALAGENVEDAFLQVLEEVYREMAAKRMKESQLGGVGSASIRKGKPLKLTDKKVDLPKTDGENCSC